MAELGPKEALNRSRCSRDSDCGEDLDLLLECLHYQQGQSPYVVQALATIASMFYNSSSARDTFRCKGGLLSVLELVYSGTDHLVQQEALFTLGCASDGNVVNKMKLCEDKLFSFLSEEVLSSQHRSLVTCGTWLLGVLLSGNGQGQNMARNNGALHTLIALFKSNLPGVGSASSSLGCAGTTNTSSDQLWPSLCGALCAATDNPQNEKNQSLCSHVFPASLSLLQHSTSHPPELLTPTLSLLSSCTAGNVAMQDRIRTVGGLSVLVKALNDVLSIDRGGLEQSMSEIAVFIVKAISAAVSEHEQNCEVVCSLDVVRILLALLECKGLDGPSMLTVVMCLGVIIEENRMGRRQLIDSDGLKFLLKSMANCRDEEMCKAATFVMQCCVLDSDSNEISSPKCDEEYEALAKMARLDEFLDPTTSYSQLAARNLSTQSNSLPVLDSVKLPVKDRVFSWLASNMANLEAPECSNRKRTGYQPEQVSHSATEIGHKKCTANLQNTPCSESEDSEAIDEVIENSSNVQVQNLKSVYLAAKAQATQSMNIKVFDKCKAMSDVAIQCDSLCCPQIQLNTQTPQDFPKGRNPKPIIASRVHPIIKKRGELKRSVQVDDWQFGENSSEETISVPTTRESLQHLEPSVQACLGSIKPEVSTSSTQVPESIGETPAMGETPANQVQVMSGASVSRRDIVKCSPKCCLGCKTRLKCPLITSKNFLKMLRVDCHTCYYHKRLVSRMSQKASVSSVKSDHSSKNNHSNCKTTKLCPRPPHPNPHFNKLTLKSSTDKQTSAAATQFIHRTDYTGTVNDDSLLSHQHQDTKLQDCNRPSMSGIQTLEVRRLHSSANDMVQRKKPGSRFFDINTSPKSTHQETKSDFHFRNSKPHETSTEATQCNPQTNCVRKQRSITSAPLYNYTVCKKKTAKPQRTALRNVSNQNTALSVFNYNSPRKRISESRENCPPKLLATSAKPTGPSRPRIKFSRREEQNLINGVSRIGKRWRHILAGYSFHPSRTVVDLKDKYYNLQAKGIV